MPLNNLEGEIYDIEDDVLLNGGAIIPGPNSRASGGSVLKSILLPLPDGEIITFSADGDGIIRQDNSMNLPK